MNTVGKKLYSKTQPLLCNCYN